MGKSDILEKQKEIFGKLQLLSNKLKAIGDQVSVNEGITIRQWLLTVAIAQFGDNPPTLGELGGLMGSTHQNVKQLALKLQSKGFICMEKDEHDLRAIRLRLTEKSYLYWEETEIRFKSLLTKLFIDLSEDEINSLYACTNKFYEGIRKGKGF